MPEYKKSTTGQLIAQAVKELGLSVADHAMRGNDRGALANAAADTKRRSNDVEQGEYINSKSYAYGQDDGDGADSEDSSDSDKKPPVRTVWK